MDNPRFQMVLTPEGYDALKQIADRDNRVIAEVVRIAIEQYVERELKQKVNFKVKRGGNRREDTDKESS